MTFPLLLCNDKHYMQTPGLYFFMVWLGFNYLTTSVLTFLLLANKTISGIESEREREKENTENSKLETH